MIYKPNKVFFNIRMLFYLKNFYKLPQCFKQEFKIGQIIACESLKLKDRRVLVLNVIQNFKIF